MIYQLDDLSDEKKIFFLCHEYAMELEDINKNALKIEINSLGTDSYIITKKLYYLIINDLTSNLNIKYSYKKNSIQNHNAIVNAFVPKKYLKYLYPAIKIFFRSKKLMNIYNNISDNYIYCKNKYITVCELWRNEDYFTIFATASRSDKLNNLSKNELIKFIKNMINDIFNFDLKIKKIYKKYWKNAYHYPNMIDKTFFKENKYSCGEWLSPIFDASLNSAMNSAVDTFNQLIHDNIL